MDGYPVAALRYPVTDSMELTYVRTYGSGQWMNVDEFGWMRMILTTL